MVITGDVSVSTVSHDAAMTPEAAQTPGVFGFPTGLSGILPMSHFSRLKSTKTMLSQEGYVYIPGTEFQLTAAMQQGLAEIAAHFHDLPVDDYAPSRNRYRELRRFTLLEYHGIVLRPKEACSYTQSVDHNKEVGGVQRKFEPIPDCIANSAFLHDLILHDFELCEFTLAERISPFDVGVHFIRMYARPGVPGVSVPDELHKDGEPYTFVHLIGREDVIGGESVVADNNKKPKFEMTLSQPLDTLGVKDKLVYHQARRVEVNDGAKCGYRDVILIDFSPMYAFVER